MENFALTCTTCNSRLKVRDPGAIGQIMACPKCGGMVLVKPPAGPVASASSDSGATRPDLSSSLRPVPHPPANLPLKSDAFDAIDELLGDVPARTMVPTPTVKSSSPQAAPRMEPPKGSPPTIIRTSEPGKSPDSQAKTVSAEEIPGVKQPAAKVVAGSLAPSAAQSPRALSTSPAALAGTTVNAAPVNVAPVAAAGLAKKPVAPVATASIPVPTDDDLGPPADSMLAGSPWQYWAIVSASGLLGVALAVGVVLVTISWLADPPTPVTPPLVQNPNPEAVAPPVKPAESPAPAPVEAPAPEQAPSAPATPLENPIANVPPKPTAEAASPEPMPSAPAPAVPAAPPERDPLGLTEPAPAPAQPARPTDDPLKKFDNFLGGPGDPIPSAPQPEVKPALPPPEEEPANSPTSPVLPKPQPRHIDVAARLADPLPAIEIKDAPLADFLQIMQDMSTVPITLRPDGLAMVKLVPFSSETPLTWQGKGTTVVEAIQGALAPLGLEARLEADQLIIDVASPQLATMRMGVKDLTGGDEAAAAQLAEMLQAVVAPDTWLDDETGPGIVVGKDEIQVRQHRTVLAECVLVTEKLRVARGLKPQSKFDAKLFELTTRQQKAAPALATPITLNYSQPTPLVRVLERLGKTAGVRILVDWQALAAAGWNSDGEVTLTAEKQSLSKTLDDLTRRMELAWRVVDGKTLQVTSAQALGYRTEFELYPLGQAAKDEAAGATLVAKLRAAIGNQHFRDAGGRGELRFDLAGKCLLASLPQPQQQQLATLLEKAQ